MTIRVNADLFRIVYTTVSSEETRYYLNGVHIEPHQNGALMVATDGHRMIVAHDTAGECTESAIVKLPRFALAQCRTPKMFEKKRVVEVENGSATIIEMVPAEKKGEFLRESLLTAHKAIIDGTFPDWMRLVPSEISGSGTSGAVNPKYIKAWGDVGVELSRLYGGVGSIALYSSDPNSPMLVRFEGAKNVFGIQMPMRTKLSPRLPDFMAKREMQQAA